MKPIYVAFFNVEYGLAQPEYHLDCFQKSLQSGSINILFFIVSLFNTNLGMN